MRAGAAETWLRDARTVVPSHPPVLQLLRADTTTVAVSMAGAAGEANLIAFFLFL